MGQNFNVDMDPDLVFDINRNPDPGLQIDIDQGFSSDVAPDLIL